jgi:hypothetical protein
MKKIKDFGSFMNEKNNIDDNIANENFYDALASSGVVIDAISIAGLVGTIGSLIGSGVMISLEGSKLGERGKEFAHKIKSIFHKGEQIKKEGGDETAYAEEVANELENYDDVISELESGRLGEEGQDVADKLIEVKDSAENTSGKY